jgi:hypothetical protein
MFCQNSKFRVKTEKRAKTSDVKTAKRAKTW